MYLRTGRAISFDPKQEKIVGDAKALDEAGAFAIVYAIVVGCFIHKPDRRRGHYGGTVAAPAVMRTMEQSLLYLGVPPQDPESMNTH